MGRDVGEVRQRRQDSQRSLHPHEEPDDADWPYAQGNLDPLGKFIGLSVMVVSLSLVTYFRYQQYLRDIVITPLDAPLIFAANATGADVFPDRFWGTYRPQTYFGLKTRSPNSPVFGAMWFKQFTKTTTTPPPLHHWCDEGDGLHGYSWLLHDGKLFGVQELEDEGFTVRTEYVKRAGGQHGGDWTARITMTPKSTGEEVVVSSMFYVALDGKGSVQPLFTNNMLTRVIGHTHQLGDFHLKFPVSRNKNQTTLHLITHVSNLTQLTNAVKFSMKEKVWNKSSNSSYFTLGGQKMPPDPPGINCIVKEVIATLPLEMEVVVESGSFYSRPDMLTRDVFDTVLGNHVDDFTQKLSDVFQLEKKGFGVTEVHMAQAALSNMLGSIGYFYGSSLVQSDYNQVPVKYWAAPLFSSVRSRSFPSHGSLWDAGFHTLVISHWDEGLALEIVGHWLDLINTEGWIPREIIFRDEACAKAPAKCVAQDNRMAAPLTLFLALQRLIPRLMGSQDPAKQQFLAALYPRLEAWYAWYNSSHTGSTMSVYWWRGRKDITLTQINSWTVASGLQDYLRASHPSDDDRHVDLRCWMALSSGVMAELARSLKIEQWKEYAATHQLLTDNALLDHLHWSEESQQYSDYGLHTDEVKLEKQSSSQFQFQSGQPISDKAKHRVSISEPKYQFVNTFSYVSLFPFLLKIIDTQSPELYKILTDLKDPSLLWSQYGLRSLAPTNRFYQLCKKEHSPASWCEDVWINMNFLTLAALHHYTDTEGPHSQLPGDIYSELRRNLVNNVAKQFQRTGYLWEHYSDRNG